MRVLLVEDDAALGASIARALPAENFAVDIAINGEDGSHIGETEIYDAAVLDLGLPKRDGVSVVKGWRDRQPRFAGRGAFEIVDTGEMIWKVE